MIAGKLLEKSDDETLGGKLGYNAATDKFEDLVAAGVIDPVKVGLPAAHTVRSTKVLLCGPGVAAPKDGSGWQAGGKASSALLLTNNTLHI